jgi:hypothetical protein
VSRTARGSGGGECGAPGTPVGSGWDRTDGMGDGGQSDRLTIFAGAAGHQATKHTVACLQRFQT